MVEKRVVSINPDFFKISSTNTTRKRPPTNGEKPALKIKEPKPQKEKTSKTIKKNLLNYIRRFQNKNYDEIARSRPDITPTQREPTTSVNHHSSDFKDSLDYLMKLTKENEKNHHHNQTIRNPVRIPTNENVSLSLPLEFIQPPSPSSPPIHINQPRTPLPLPQYGCMKNGSLPTYRNWKNQTQKNLPQNTFIGGQSQTQQPETPKEKLLREKIEELKRRSTINPIASSPLYSGGSQHQEKIATQIAQINYGKKLEQQKKENRKRIPKRQKTMRRTYRVGKSKIAPKVSVLVSNKTIRKNIYTQAILLKQTPIKEVKRYLIKHGFIRVGSVAPNDILRKMYENARLICGELKNHNPDNLLYNFMHGDNEEK